ncbi:hypothetical protein [Kitasatospora purpeofusca]|uniref:hypothetical protein n=1 Tax=Kitasatospora purpeofusca TaxID=67352 RepID=UPI0004BEF221|nr:hypothetical protein [Kitasatospora purpeofusca]
MVGQARGRDDGLAVEATTGWKSPLAAVQRLTSWTDPSSTGPLRRQRTGRQASERGQYVGDVPQRLANPTNKSSGLPTLTVSAEIHQVLLQLQVPDWSSG